MKITLTPREMYLGASVGITRRVQDLRDERKPVYGEPGFNEWNVDIEGALGEMAAAKALGVFWTGSGLGDPDVGTFQVRTTSRLDGRLIIHKRDADNDRFILVVGKDGLYDAIGWCSGAAGKRSEWWTDPKTSRPAYFVPQSALEPLESIGAKKRRGHEDHKDRPGNLR